MRPEPYFVLLEEYEAWLESAAVGDSLVYIRGELPELREANSRVDEIANRAWRDAGGWPRLTDFHTNLRQSMMFKTDESVRVCLVQRRVCEKYTEYIAQKLR